MSRDDATLLDLVRAARLIHGYDTVDLQLVWQTVEHDVPTLLAHLEPLLPSHEA